MHRGVGAVYAGVGAVLALLGLVIPASYLYGGQLIPALICFVVLLVLGVGFVRLGLPMLRTVLQADPAGVRGRTPEGQVVDLGWPAVTIDGEENVLRLEIGVESVRLSDGGWVGFGDFVDLVARTPAAADRLTPDAREELVRLLFGPAREEEPPAA